MEPADLERQVDRALRQLPAPRAPRSLAPRVMRAITAAPRAVRAAGTGWRRWPLGWQVLLLVAASWMAAGLVVLGPFVSSWIGQTAVARAAGIIWEAVIAPLAAPAVVLVAVMGAASALLVAALKFVAWEGHRTSLS